MWGAAAASPKKGGGWNLGNLRRPHAADGMMSRVDVVLADAPSSHRRGAGTCTSRATRRRPYPPAAAARRQCGLCGCGGGGWALMGGCQMASELLQLLAMTACADYDRCRYHDHRRRRPGTASAIVLWHRVALTKPQAGRGPGYRGGLVYWDHCVEGSLVEKCEEYSWRNAFRACCVRPFPTVQRQ